MNIIRPKPTLTYPLTDKQVIFDHVWHHFIVEKNPHGTVMKSNVCSYNTPTGGCAIGCLLKPEERAKIPMDAVFGIASCFPINSLYGNHIDDRRIIARHFDETNAGLINFLAHLQGAHDGSFTDLPERRYSSFIRRLEMVAEVHGLTLPVDVNSIFTAVETPQFFPKEGFIATSGEDDKSVLNPS